MVEVRPSDGLPVGREPATNREASLVNWVHGANKVRKELLPYLYANEQFHSPVRMCGRMCVY